jgi:hypothetical protein
MYYFASCEVDSDNLGMHRDQRIACEPCIEDSLQDALARYKSVADLQ